MLNPLLRVRASYLRVQSLESRLMLSVSPISDSVSSDRIDDGHGGSFFGVLLDDEAWHELNRDAALDLLEEHSDDASVLPDPHAGAGQPMVPAIPFDDSLDPLNECPDMEPEFCLPGDATQDGTVDFLDFLLLNQNYGLENATWADGDFDGDGRIGFGDLLLLSSNFGTSH